jgi:hypothetical protein
VRKPHLEGLADGFDSFCCAVAERLERGRDGRVAEATPAAEDGVA